MVTPRIQDTWLFPWSSHQASHCTISWSTVGIGVINGSKSGERVVLPEATRVRSQVPRIFLPRIRSDLPPSIWINSSIVWPMTGPLRATDRTILGCPSPARYLSYSTLKSSVTISSHFPERSTPGVAVAHRSPLGISLLMSGASAAESSISSIATTSSFTIISGGVSTSSTATTSSSTTVSGAPESTTSDAESSLLSSVVSSVFVVSNNKSSYFIFVETPVLSLISSLSRTVASISSSKRAMKISITIHSGFHINILIGNNSVRTRRESIGREKRFSFILWMALRFRPLFPIDDVVTDSSSSMGTKNASETAFSSNSAARDTLSSVDVVFVADSGEATVRKSLLGCR
mmetsp:Transcript_19589/g.48779  ORF Transcript_19589/g.48779 Transcript_19589/m.48779 type:complete len:347 (-) Transcript_19589:360-1400(-)